MEDRATTDFRSMVDAVRSGTVFAYDLTAYQAWLRRTATDGPSLMGDALERAVMNVARMFPGQVVYGPD